MESDIRISDKEHILGLLEEVERTGVDIAPNYGDYVCLAYALSAVLDEDEGRDIFHRFCRLCPKYDERHAGKTYDSCARTNDHRVTAGSIVRLCKLAGVDTGAVWKRLAERARGSANGANNTNDTNNTNNTATFPVSFQPSGGGAEAEEVTWEADPETPLPTFGALDLPYPLDLIYGRGQTPAQCDAVLLSALTVIGAAMDWHVCTKYSDVYQYPCLQLFVIAPAASGKGIMARTRQLADPLHQERMGTYSTDYTRSVIARNEWAEKVKNKEVTPKPDDAVRQMFLIPGNNTGTGILQNIIDSKGNGLIFEVEADTVSAAIAGDYGHWSDTLRKAFDHDRLSYNRRTDREYKDLNCIRLGVVVSGTPGQLFPLIPSAENGLFSRQIFYYMPRSRDFISQFDEDNKRENNTEFFERLAGNFMNLLRKIEACGIIELRLRKEQIREFNDRFTRIFREAGLALGGELDSTVFRQAVNAVRVMSVVAALREMEEHGGAQLEEAGCMVKSPDGEYRHLHYLEISDRDLQTVLHIFEVLYQHSIHILSFLKSSRTERRVLSGWMLVLQAMPREFTRQKWYAECERRDIKKCTADTWLQRVLKKGLIKKAEERAHYEKTV